MKREEIKQKILDYITQNNGKALTFPVVKRFIQYKTPHWLPTVFLAGPER